MAVLALVAATACSNRSDISAGRMIAFAWGDGKYGPAFYGAHVYFEPLERGVEVKARVHIGRGNDYVQDCGVIGKAESPEDAVRKFGRITFAPDGLHVGPADGGPDAYVLPRDKLEAHR